MEKCDVSDHESLDLSYRFLCADGTCVGTIDDSGYCKVCGKPLDEADVTEFERAHGTNLPADFLPYRAPISPVHTEHTDVPRTIPTPQTPRDPSERVLCADGTCVGIISDDGRCGTCGMPSVPQSSPSLGE